MQRRAREAAPLSPVAGSEGWRKEGMRNESGVEPPGWLSALHTKQTADDDGVDVVPEGPDTELSRTCLKGWDYNFLLFCIFLCLFFSFFFFFVLRWRHGLRSVGTTLGEFERLVVELICIFIFIDWLFFSLFVQDRIRLYWWWKFMQDSPTLVSDVVTIY